MPFQDLSSGQGRVLPEQRIALYRDDRGELHAMSSVCTHKACDVGWNETEKVWDCPCHGSRFAATGEVLRGPALKPLAVVPIPEGGS
jgi:Rieske Fe-S protein